MSKDKIKVFEKKKIETRLFNFYMKDDVRTKLNELCVKENGRSMSNLIQGLISTEYDKVFKKEEK